MTSLSSSLRLLILEQFTDGELIELAAIRRARGMRAIVRRSLSRASAEEMADLLLSGGRPTIGFFRRRVQRDLPGQTEAAA